MHWKGSSEPFSATIHVTGTCTCQCRCSGGGGGGGSNPIYMLVERLDRLLALLEKMARGDDKKDQPQRPCA